MKKFSSREFKLFSLLLLLIPYILYVGFVIKANQGPVDYETFVNIGHRFLSGTQIYGENSYYPMPFVMIFAFFSWLPRPMSMAIWLLTPVITALIISKGNPLILLFAPLFSHFIGGQTAIFGMIGLWGYRKYIETNNPTGGVFLGLTLLKPQLGLIPLTYAFFQWFKVLLKQKIICKQALAWVITLTIIYLPSFLIFPDWITEWLRYPRPLFERALSGLFPRTILFFISQQTPLYWLVLVIISLLLLIAIWFINHKSLSIDLAVIWSFVLLTIVPFTRLTFFNK